MLELFLIIIIINYNIFNIGTNIVYNYMNGKYIIFLWFAFNFKF